MTEKIKTNFPIKMPAFYADYAQGTSDTFPFNWLKEKYRYRPTRADLAEELPILYTLGSYKASLGGNANPYGALVDLEASGYQMFSPVLGVQEGVWCYTPEKRFGKKNTPLTPSKAVYIYGPPEEMGGPGYDWEAMIGRVSLFLEEERISVFADTGGSFNNPVAVFLPRANQFVHIPATCVGPATGGIPEFSYFTFVDPSQYVGGELLVFSMGDYGVVSHIIGHTIDETVCTYSEAIANDIAALSAARARFGRLKIHHFSNLDFNTDHAEIEDDINMTVSGLFAEVEYERGYVGIADTIPDRIRAFFSQ